MGTPQVLAISKNADFMNRSKTLTEFFQGNFLQRPHADQLDFEEPNPGIDAVIISATDVSDPTQASGFVQVAKYFCPQADILVVVEKKVSTAQAEFINKSGADSVLLEDEFYGSNKAEYLVSRKMTPPYLVFKSAELKPGTLIPFSVYHMLPLNQKMLAILQKGQIIDKSKLEKFETVGEFYLLRDEAPQYQEYVEKNQDRSAQGLKARCRAQYMNLTLSFRDMVRLITDQSKGASFDEGKALMDRVISLCQNLLGSLGAGGDPWEIVNNSSLADGSVLDRSPAIAAMAGMMSLMSGVGDPLQVMIAALLADLGLLELRPAAMKAYLADRITALNDDDMHVYTQHPTISVNKCLARKLQMDENIKKMILNSHETADQKGFPSQTRPERIPEETYLLQFAELLDKKCKVVMGKSRVSVQDAKKELYTELSKTTRFPAGFMLKLKAVI